MEIATQRLKVGEIIDDIIHAFPDYGESIAKTFDEDMDFIRKSDASDVIEVRESERVIVGRITSYALDRDNEVILPQGGDFTHYNKNRVVLWSHDYGGGLFGGTTYELPHARNMWLTPYPKTGPREIRAGTQYATKEMNEFGDRVFNYRMAKWPLGYSIGFIPIERIEPSSKEWNKTLKWWQGRIATEQNLLPDDVTPPNLFYSKWAQLEYSDVKIPANPEALDVMKSFGIIDEKELDSYIIKQPADEPINIEKPYPNEHACRLRQPGDFQANSFRRSKREHEGKPYSVIMGKLTGENTMTEQAYRYDKDIWTATEAKAHCNSHDGQSFEAASPERGIDLLFAELQSLRAEISLLRQQPAEDDINLDEIETDEINIESISVKHEIDIESIKLEPPKDIFKIQDIPTPEIIKAQKSGKVI